MRELLIGVLPVFGVVIGSILTHVFERSKNRHSQQATARQDAYADYLRAVSALAVARSPASVGQLIDAKSRMAIYASNAVLDRLAEFEATELVMSDPSARKCFTKLADQMRSENGAGASKGDTLAVVLFGISEVSGATQSAS